MKAWKADGRPLAFGTGSFIDHEGPGPTQFTAEQLRDEVSRHWHVDEVRPASLFSAAAKRPDATVVTAGEPDAQGRVELPAYLCSAHKGARRSPPRNWTP